MPAKLIPCTFHFSARAQNATVAKQYSNITNRDVKWLPVNWLPICCHIFVTVGCVISAVAASMHICVICVSIYNRHDNW